MESKRGWVHRHIQMGLYIMEILVTICSMDQESILLKMELLYRQLGKKGKSMVQELFTIQKNKEKCMQHLTMIFNKLKLIMGCVSTHTKYL